MIELKAHVETMNKQNRLETKGKSFFFRNDTGKLNWQTNANDKCRNLKRKVQIVLSSSILNVTLSFLYY